MVITGGNTGIGRAVCKAFAQEGSNVVVGWYEHETEANSLVDEIIAENVTAKAIPVDVTDETSVKEFFNRTIELFQNIDILINNAGVQKAQPITKMSLKDWESMMTVHLRGAFLCSRAVTRHMATRGNGAIINVCSQLGYIGRENYTAYSAAKGGLIAFTRALAKELAPQGIRVNGVSPGLVDTGFDPISEKLKNEHASRLPLARLGTPDDMTSAFIFLACEESAYFCGQLLHPNGGEIMP